MFHSRTIGKMLMISCLVAFPKAVFAQTPSILPTTPKETTPVQSGYGLDELVSLGMTKHPRLSQASLAIESARGRALQAGLYPNPTISFNFDELGDRTGPQGVNTLPLVTQEIVTGGKLRLSQAVAGKEVDQATLLLAQERFELLARIRSAYFDVITTQMRIDILKKLVAIANASVEQGNKQLRGAEAARLDVIQFEVERERLLAELATTEKELPALYRRLAAIIGDPNLPLPKVTGSIDIALPSYELEPLIRFVVDNHPEKQSAIIGISRAQLQLEREKVEPYPNVTLGAGYVRQNQNRSNDWTVNFSLPLPLWNRNQGKISSAMAAVGSSQFEVERVENELVDRVSSAFRDFTAARQRTERYKTGIIPRSEEIYRIVDQGYRNGAFDYLKVLDAQRTLSQAHLERIRATGEAWKAASVISGLSMEEEWPRLLPGYVVPKPGDLLPPAAK